MIDSIDPDFISTRFKLPHVKVRFTLLDLLFSSDHSPIFFIMLTNSSKEISPSPFSSTYLMIASIAALSKLPPNPSTSLISLAEITPDPSLSNILKAACSLSLVVNYFSFMAATTNSE